MEARVAVLESKVQDAASELHDLKSELRTLNGTVTEIHAGVKVFRWVFSAMVALGPVLGVLLAKVMQ
jgi:hypothetical protein